MQHLQLHNQPFLWLQLCYWWCEQSHFHRHESRCWILSDRLLLQPLLLHAHLLPALTHHDHGQGGQWHSTLTNSQFKVGNLLVHIRCVDEDDKALGMAIQVTGLTHHTVQSLVNSGWSKISQILHAPQTCKHWMVQQLVNIANKNLQTSDLGLCIIAERFNHLVRGVQKMVRKWPKNQF